MSCIPDLLLSVRDAKTTETNSSLDQEPPQKEGGSAPPEPASMRYCSSVPDLRNASLLSCPGLELSKPVSRIQEAKSACAVNVLTGTVVSRAVSPPRGLNSAGVGGSLAFWSFLCL